LISAARIGFLLLKLAQHEGHARQQVKRRGHVLPFVAVVS
jgi:hypothetical protein